MLLATTWIDNKPRQFVNIHFSSIFFLSYKNPYHPWKVANIGQLMAPTQLLFKVYKGTKTHIFSQSSDTHNDMWHVQCHMSLVKDHIKMSHLPVAGLSKPDKPAYCCIPVYAWLKASSPELPLVRPGDMVVAARLLPSPCSPENPPREPLDWDREAVMVPRTGQHGGHNWTRDNPLIHVSQKQHLPVYQC